ncbi:MAG: 4Fe-4S dicluster domain-containing protein [Candidatus Omnitrophica bacterium]|nr:4Fe-4S dicluster domain-containing protein [Candidatus Omnitrophota bacterium]
MNRKEFLISLTAVITAILTPLPLMKLSRKNSFIRPPGSIEESFFYRLCIRCGQCIRACPAKCLKQVRLERSFESWLTPEIIPREKGCILCQNCSKVCPTGTIRNVNQQTIKIGTASIYENQCLVWTHQKECLVCFEFCPVHAVYLDEQGRPIVNPEICAGCGLCEENCPVTTKQAAIRVTSTGERRIQFNSGKYV